MTYKAIVKDLLEKDSKQWVKKLLVENGLMDEDEERGWICSAECENMTNEGQHISYEVKVVIVWKEGLPIHTDLRVGGTIDDMVGLCHSVIWNDDKSDIIWMATKTARLALGITEFKLS